MVWSLDPAVTRADLPRVVARFQRLVRGTGAAEVVCDAGAVADPDLVTIELLARLRLVATRHGRRLRVRSAGPRLRELLALTGLSGELGWQPEQREQPGSVEERADPHDPVT